MWYLVILILVLQGTSSHTSSNISRCRLLVLHPRATANCAEMTVAGEAMKSLELRSGFGEIPPVHLFNDAGVDLDL